MTIRIGQRFVFVLQIWVQALCVWFVFFVTLTIFPGIWSNISKKDFPIEGKICDENVFLNKVQF